MDYEDNLEGVEDEIDDVIDDQGQQQQQHVSQPPPQPQSKPRRQTKSQKPFSNNNQDEVMNLVQGIIENQEKERMKQRAQRLYKQLICGTKPIRNDDDYYDDDYDDYDEYENQPPIRQPPRQRGNWNQQEQNNGDIFLELFDDLSNTITEDSKKYRIDAINKEFGLDNLFTDEQNNNQTIDDDPSSKTSDEGQNNGPYGGELEEEMIQIPKRIANNLEKIYVKYLNVHKVIKELKDIFSNEQLQMTRSDRRRARRFRPY